VKHRGKLAAALCILALVTFSESELRKGNDSVTPGAIFTAASQLRTVAAHPACLGGSPSFSPLLQCIGSKRHFILLRLVEEVLGMKRMKKERLFGKEAKWEGKECPNEGGER